MDFRHPLPRCECISDRQRLILEYCRNKTVLHLGCVDSGNVRELFGRGELLHLQVRAVAKRVVGIDIDAEGIRFLAEQGVTDLICGDLEKMHLRDVGGAAEVVIAGEIIEHLPNPGVVIESIGELLEQTKGIVLITVPNVFSIRHLAAVLLRSTELVNPDHNFYFSYATLSRLLQRGRLEPVQWYTYFDASRIQSSVKKHLKKYLALTFFRIFPFVAEGLIVIARRVNSERS